MIDFARIKVIAGGGGNGAGSFEHIKGKRRGKADGGDGGRGGNVYMVAWAHINTLEPFRFVKEYKASPGGHGMSKKCTGAEAGDLDVKVPVGTVVRVKSQSDESKAKSQALAKMPPGLKPGFKASDQGFLLSTLTFDLVVAGQRVLVARGGEGGRGNRHLRDDYGRRPLRGELGKDGEKVELELELKLIADVGLVGLPNAGKSTLISTLTSAKPKIANYPFTTLEPNLGVLEISAKGQALAKQSPGLRPGLSLARLVIADIPGLIEGASEGKGLGDLFLRHIERTRILVHLIDLTESDLMGAYNTIRGEIKAYSKELGKKREIIVLTKKDLVTGDIANNAVELFKNKRRRALVISAVTGEGVSELIREIVKKASPG